MGMFDDLIPQAPEGPKPVSAQSTGMFDDLIPPSAPPGRRQLIGPLTAPAIERPATYGAEVARSFNESVQQAKHGLQYMTGDTPEQQAAPKWQMNWGEPFKAAGSLYDVAAGALGAIASPATAAFRHGVSEPVESVTGIPAENVEDALLAGMPGMARGRALGLSGPAARASVLSPQLRNMPPVPPPGPPGAGAAAVDPAIQAAKEFDIPYSRGQAQQDMEAIRREDLAARGAYGKPAQDIAVPWFQRQFEKVGEAGQRIGEQFADQHPVVGGTGEAAATVNAEVAQRAAEARHARGQAQARAQQEGEAQRGMVADQAALIEDALRGGYTPIENVRETGEVVASNVRAQAAADRDYYRNLYNEAFALPGEFHAGAFEGIGQRIKGELSGGDNPVIVDDVTTPVASRAIRDLDNISNLRIQNRAAPMGAPNPENIVGVDLRGVDQARKRLVAYYQAARSSAPMGQVTPDVRAMGQTLDAFDNQVEHAISNGLFSGDDRALDALREARAAYRNYAQTYRPRGSGDDVGTAIRRIVDRQATPEETANMILGSGRLGNAGLPVRLADRLETILGRNSDGWSTIRQAMWQRASQVRNAAGEIDPVRSATSIEQFAGSSLGRRMFQPYELAAMRNHAQAVRQLDRTIEMLPETAEAERAARGYETLFGGEGIGGAQQAVFRRIVEGTATPEETANAVFGAVGSGNPGNAVRMVDAIERITGASSETMSAIRQGVWQRITQAPSGKDQPGAQKLAQNINEFLNGRGRTISERLYGPDELELMQRYADAVKRTVIPKYARTNSDTAPALVSMARNASLAVSSALLSHIPFVGRLANLGVEKLIGRAATRLSDAAEARRVAESLDYSEKQALSGTQPGAPSAQPLQRTPTKIARTGRAMATEPLRMGRETDVLKAGANLATGEHPARIDQRLPTSKRVFGTDPENLKVDVAAAKESPKTYANNVDLLRNYPNMPVKLARGSDDKVANGFVDHVADNLKWLWDQVPPEVRDRSMQWYDGGNKIVKDWSQEYGLRDSTVAAVLASLSPQKDWFKNVSLARRTLDIMRNKDVAATPEMAKQFASRESLQKYAPIFDRMNGKSLADIDRMNDLSPESKSAMKAMWVRLYDEAHNDPSHRIVTPEGEFGDYVKTDKGANSKIGWGSLGEISKAIESIERDDPTAAQTLLGAKHKVRNFYNNLLSPNSATGDVTVDTHAVAAGLLRPLSGHSIEVAHNFENYAGKGLPSAAGSDVTGVRGTYPFYADAYRKAANAIGVLPRQLQSVTWEAVRSLFPENLKNATLQAEVDGIWDRYRKGRATLDDTRNKILAAAGAEGGIKPPSWFETRPGAGADAGLPHSADEAELSRSGVPRQAAEGAGGGGGGQPAATISAEGMNERVAAGAEAQGLPGRGELPGSSVGVAPPSAASHPLGPEEPLRGLPTKVTVPGMGKIDVGPNPKIRRVAADYMQKAGLPYDPPITYAKVDEDLAKRIADAFDAMPHAPNDPEVKAAYKAMAKETMAQWRNIQKTELKVEFIRGGDPYAASPRLAVKDINENNHMWVFSTRDGFGSGHAFSAKDIADNPLLAPAGVKISGQPATVNDIFRIVHDYFGHAKEGVGFRADGEENAWRSHSAMYSPLARKAMTTETRGQNSWLNFGPHGEANRTAKTENTIFADQKVGLLPDWVVTEGSGDAVQRRAAGGRVESGTGKRTRDSFGYMEPSPNIPDFAQCGSCQLWIKDRNRCHWFSDDKVVEASDSCTEYVQGEPIKGDVKATNSLDPKEAGFIKGSTRCENCVSFNKDKPSCMLFEKLNRAQPDIFDLDEKVKPRGCCNAFSRDPARHEKIARRASGGRVNASVINHNPTEAQKASGVYAKDHLHRHGLPITIENAKGSVRRGVGKDGKPWEARLGAHYGYLRRHSDGADGDPIDVYLGDHAKAQKVFTIDQVDADNGKFDEHKLFLSFANKAQALRAYERSFSDGKARDRIGHVTEMTVDQLRHWLESGDTKKPLKGTSHAPKIDTTKDVRWMSEMSKSGDTYYRDRSLPKQIVNNGKWLPIDEPLKRHEVAEYNAIKRMVEDFEAKHGRKPDDAERETIYLKCHKEHGEVAEHNWLKENGFDVKAWESWVRGKLAHLEHKRIAKPPPNPHVRPSPHDRRQLETTL